MEVEDQLVGPGRGPGFEAVRAQAPALDRAAPERTASGGVADSLERLPQGKPPVRDPLRGVQRRGEARSIRDAGSRDQLAFGLAMAVAVGQPHVARTQGVAK